MSKSNTGRKANALNLNKAIEVLPQVETVNAPVASEAPVDEVQGVVIKPRQIGLQLRGNKYVTSEAQRASGTVSEAIVAMAREAIGFTPKSFVNALCVAYGLNAIGDDVTNKHTAKRGGGIIAEANATAGQPMARRLQAKIEGVASIDYMASQNAYRNAASRGKIATVIEAVHIVNATLWAYGQISGKGGANTSGKAGANWANGKLLLAKLQA